MTKRYFIRRSHSDLVQEQNKLLETLLAKQEDRKAPVFLQASNSIKEDYALDVSSDVLQPEKKDVYFELDEMPYIPTSHNSNVKLQSVETSKAAFDETGIEKLRKTKKANAKLD